MICFCCEGRMGWDGWVESFAGFHCMGCGELNHSYH